MLNVLPRNINTLRERERPSRLQSPLKEVWPHRPPPPLPVANRQTKAYSLLPMAMMLAATYLLRRESSWTLPPPPVRRQNWSMDLLKLSRKPQKLSPGKAKHQTVAASWLTVEPLLRCELVRQLLSSWEKPRRRSIRHSRVQPRTPTLEMLTNRSSTRKRRRGQKRRVLTGWPSSPTIDHDSHAAVFLHHIKLKHLSANCLPLLILLYNR